MKKIIFSILSQYKNAFKFKGTTDKSAYITYMLFHSIIFTALWLGWYQVYLTGDSGSKLGISVLRLIIYLAISIFPTWAVQNRYLREMRVGWGWGIITLIPVCIPFFGMLLTFSIPTIASLISSRIFLIVFGIIAIAGTIILLTQIFSPTKIRDAKGVCINYGSTDGVPNMTCSYTCPEGFSRKGAFCYSK